METAELSSKMAKLQEQKAAEQLHIAEMDKKVADGS